MIQFLDKIYHRKVFLLFFKSSFTKYLLKVHGKKIIQNKIEDLVPSKANKIIIFLEFILIKNLIL